MELTTNQSRALRAAVAMTEAGKNLTMPTMRKASHMGAARHTPAVHALTAMGLLVREEKPPHRLVVAESLPRGYGATAAEERARIVHVLRVKGEHVLAAQFGDRDHWDPVFDDG